MTRTVVIKGARSIIGEGSELMLEELVAQPHCCFKGNKICLKLWYCNIRSVFSGHGAFQVRY